MSIDLIFGLKETIRNNTNVLKKQEAVIVWADLEFGVFSKDCRNFGICKIHQNSFVPLYASKEKKCRCNHALTKIIYDANGHLSMQFFKSELSNHARKKYFANKFFKMEESLDLPKFLCDKMKCKSFLIREGMYKILEYQSFFSVKFFESS